MINIICYKIRRLVCKWYNRSLPLRSLLVGAKNQPDKRKPRTLDLDKSLYEAANEKQIYNVKIWDRALTNDKVGSEYNKDNTDI